MSITVTFGEIMSNLKEHLGWTVESIRTKKDKCEISVLDEQDVATCEYCYSENIVKFGRRSVKISDLPQEGVPVVIVVSQNRYHCNDCNKTFVPALSQKAVKHSVTIRLSQYIGRQGLIRPFTEISKEVGIHANTVRDVFLDFYDQAEYELSFETPESLGIECVNIVKPSTLLVNVNNNTILNLLSGQTADDISTILQSLLRLHKVKRLYIGMYPEYRTLAATLMPTAAVIVHKSHVLRLADDAVERTRIAVRCSLTAIQRRVLSGDKELLSKRYYDLSKSDRERLTEWASSYPEITIAYKYKEQARRIFEGQSISIAKVDYEAWRSSIPPAISSYFAPMIKAIDDWYEEVFAYIENTVTTDVVELSQGLEAAANNLPRRRSFMAVKGALLFDTAKNNYGVKAEGFISHATS